MGVLSGIAPHIDPPAPTRKGALALKRYGDPAERGRTYRRRPGIYVIARHGGALLLTLQAEPGREIQLPGGGIDPGEQPVAALHREVLEETGWRIAAPRRLTVYRRFTYMPEYDLWAEKLCHIYVARAVRPLHPPTEPGHAALVVPAAEAVALVASAGDRAILRDLLRAGRL